MAYLPLTTPGIKCVNIFILPHLIGVGDHRCFIIDLSSKLVIGSTFPNIVWRASRKLHCSLTRMITVCNTKLTHLCNEHNMFQRMDIILRLTTHLTEDNFALLMNTWDDEFKEYMLHSENLCNKYMMGHIELTPTIGVWLNR